MRNLAYKIFFHFERIVKELLFGCSMCGQCILRFTAFTCPMRCPKGMRNGPCGGTNFGKCEADLNKACAWQLIYNRAERLGMADRLQRVQPAVDWSLSGTSAWLNHLSGKDRHLFLDEKGNWIGLRGKIAR